jgi:hypothetical protein
LGREFSEFIITQALCEVRKRPWQSRNPSASRQSQAREITHKASMLPRMRRRLKY